MKQILVYYLECITDISLKIFVHVERSFNREYICNKKKKNSKFYYIYIQRYQCYTLYRDVSVLSDCTQTFEVGEPTLPLDSVEKF